MIRDFFKLVNAEKPKVAPIDTRDRWHLLLGKTILGELVYSSYETPWITADFSPSAQFAQFIPYFEWEKSKNGCLDGDAPDSEPSTEVDALIGVVLDAGGISVQNLKTNEIWQTSMHFGDDYTHATFR
jgi:hypothetical protein